METKEGRWLLKEKYHGEKSEAFFADCARLRAGEPLAYVIGSIPFLDSTIYLDSHPLIPRPETEFWVEKAIAAIRKTLPRQGLGPALGLASGDVSILDLCAGSGAIGVAVAKAIPEASVTFAEIDSSHLPTIEKNLAENTSPHDIKRYYVLKSDLLSGIDGTFDFILTNPPYIDKTANTVTESVYKYEPHLALFGGESGMEIIMQIILEARAQLAPQGQLWIEHEPFQTKLIEQFAKAHNFIVQTNKDQYDTERYSILTLPVAQ